MRLISLSVAGYRQFLEPTALDVPQGLTGICGPNGVGKSKLIEAIGYALYGWQRRLMPRGDRVADLRSRGGIDTPLRVELVLELWGRHYEIYRSQKEAWIRLIGDADPLAVTPTVVTAKVIELLGLPPAAYAATFMARQREIAGLQALDPAPRRRLVHRLIGIAQVEAAIALAEQERAGRKQAWQAVANQGGLSVDVAVADVEQAGRELAQAKTRVEGCEAGLIVAASRVAAAQQVAAVLAERRTNAAMLRSRADDGMRHRADLEKGLTREREHLSRARSAQETLMAARAVLDETTNAPNALAWQRALADVADLRDRRREVVSDLTERIGPQLQARADMESDLAGDERALDALRVELAEHGRAVAIATGEERRANDDAASNARRAEAARALGAVGICSVCGQAYGSSLGHALAHFDVEMATARESATEACARLSVARDRAAEARERIAARTTTRDGRRAWLNDDVASVGEEARALASLREIDATLGAASDELLSANYSPEQLVAAEGQLLRRNAAEATIARHEPLAAELESAGFAEREILRALQDQDLRLTNLHAAIERDEPSLAAIQAVEAELKAALAEHVGAEAAAVDARTEVASWATRAALARAALDRATDLATRVATSFRTLLIAERTEEVLRRVLAEIAEEARPRLIDMLDGWMRALLGPRFRRIDLTDDYRIRADSGSGWREIDHFSGGEQTLLAIMLRVAIALFCQERAGFERGFLILDEVFGDQDGDHRAQLVQFLGEIKDHFHQILVVNHVEDVTELLDSVIDVQPVSLTISTASVRL